MNRREKEFFVLNAIADRREETEKKENNKSSQQSFRLQIEALEAQTEGENLVFTEGFSGDRDTQEFSKRLSSVIFPTCGATLVARWTVSWSFHLFCPFGLDGNMKLQFEIAAA